MVTPFLMRVEDFVVAAFVTDEEQAQAGILERLDRVVIEIGAAVAAPGQAERCQLFRDFAGARQVRGEGVVIEEKFLHLRKELLHVGHFVGDILRRTHAIFVSADGLRPEAEGALRRATAAGVKAHVRMQQVTDEIFFDLQIALVDVRHPGSASMFVDHLAFGIVLDLAFLVPVGKPGDRFETDAFGHFLAGEIKFLAADPIDGPGSLQRFGRQHRRMRADETDLRFGPVLFDRFGDFAIVFQRRRGGVDDDVIVILCFLQALS